ncbi:MAG: glycosyltransferase family 4 protein [Candidatus Acidiferrales bacterium]
MKILVLAPPIGSTGGIQRYTATLVRSLEDIQGRNSVRVVAISAEPRLGNDGVLALSLSTKARFFATAVVQALVWQPQLIVCAHIGVAPVARVIRRIFHIPYWVMLYGIEVWGSLARSKVSALRSAQQLVSISRFTAETASARHKLSGIATVTLPPSFAVEETQTSNAYSLDAEEHPPMVLTVGRLAASEQYKGHDIMLESWTTVRETIPDAVYCIVGDGDDRARLEARTRELKIADSVRFTGAVSASELQDYYRRCRVFAMPARTEVNSQTPRGEGFGIVFLEAMAHGKPVLGPLDGAPSEFIRPGVHGILVDPRDPSAVANALVELLEDKDRANRMGQAARAWVIQEYSEEKFRQRLKKILENDQEAPKEITD